MRPHLQGWNPLPESWRDTVPFFHTSKGDLIVGNIKQSKLFHYIEKDFISNKILSDLEGAAYGKI